YVGHPPFFSSGWLVHGILASFPTRRSSDLFSSPPRNWAMVGRASRGMPHDDPVAAHRSPERLLRFRPARRGREPSDAGAARAGRSEEHTSELQSRENLVCRLLLEKKKSDRQ